MKFHSLFSAQITVKAQQLCVPECLHESNFFKRYETPTNCI